MQARQLASGTLLRGRYLLQGAIGEPGSNVFRAQHRPDNRLVAVRIQQLQPEPAEQALQVATIANRVHDPLIAAVEASGHTNNGFCFIVSEYVSGLPLDRWADKVGIPPLRVASELVEKLSRALYRAHREGIAHG